MKKITILILTLFLMFSCSNKTNVNNSVIEGNNNNSILETVLINKRVSVLEFEKALNSKEYTLIDLRTKGELVQSGVISKEAIQIDFYSPDFQIKLSELDKEKQYLIYCRSGNRSGTTLGVMKKLGFTNVLELKGGIGAWAGAGKKFVVYK